MAEVGVSVVAKLAEYLVDPTLRQLQYLFCARKITKNVEMKKEELKLKQGSVQERVQEAINKTERIDDKVDKWKKDVETLIALVETLEGELRANNSCLRGWCPTWRRYCLCKKLAKTTQRMIDLNTMSDHFNPFSHLVIIPDIEYHSSENFKLFQSTKMAFNQLCEALEDNSSSIIGLWGMGGSGKTTLVKEVGKKAKESLNFDRVVLTTISQTPSVRQIQGEIADTLGITLAEESEIGRAKRIALRLQSGERILIVLDDVWAKLNLEDVGIPFRGNHQTSFKVVMTTRRVDVCTLMECQKTIQLHLLKEEEAWALFETHINVGEAAEVDVARAIAMECKGLPIAIVAVGSCLKGKGINEMKAILDRLRNAKPINVDKGVRDAFACLELSYDYLATEAKLLLPICAMFPEDHNIDVEDLFRYGVGLGLFRHIDSFEIARSEVRTTINHLIDSSLLMRSTRRNRNRTEYVIMHDVVRDFALWKASKKDHPIMVNCTKELNEFIADDMVKDCYAIASWYHNKELLQFPFQLDAPKIEFLLLRSSETLDISRASFEVTKQLKALIIIRYLMYRGNSEILQPQPIQHLSNLRTLCLRYWDLCDISFVVSLTRLEVLDLQGSKFERVPNGIEKLSKLKLLDLSKCRIEECCYKVIGMCSQLEELYVPTHFPHSKKGSCSEYLVGPIALKKLRMYNLEIGEFDGVLGFQDSTRCLHLGHLNISILGAIIKDLAQRATAIQFYGLEGGSKSFMSSIVQAVGGMAELAKLDLDRCSEIECIMDETTLHNYAIVPRLDELVLRNMDNLHQIYQGHSPFSLFQKLETLRIYNCPQLLHIFPGGRNLGNLKFLEISGCPMLTFIFSISTICTLLSLEELRIEGCSNLKHVLEGEGGGDAWENLRFPKLKILSVDDCHKLEYVCSVFYAQRFDQLQNLSITNAPEMKFLFKGGVGEEQPVHDHDKSQLVLPLLEHLKLKNLPNLVGICSERYQTIWSSMKTLEWRDCPNMELHELKSHQWRNDEYKPLAVIEKIEVHNCNAEFIFHYQIGVGEQYPKFQFLRELRLEKCARLKFVFSTQICQSLPELTSLSISSCDELEAIFSENEVDQKNLSITESCLVKLKSLIISKCNKLRFILSFMISAATPMLPQLSTLRISDCSQMEEIFKCSNINDHDIHNEVEITFPNMKDMELYDLPMLVNVCQGFRFQTGEFCGVKVYECSKFMPIMTATIHWWTKEQLTRRYKLKHSQLNNTEAFDLPLSVLIPGEIDIQCPSVEHYWQVIGDDETNDLVMLGGPVAFQLMSFQYLHSLEVTQCKKLKFLFSKSTIVQNGLPKLDTLTLSDCEELEVIFGHSGSEDDANYGETIVLSSLREIQLENLPNLKSVCQVGLQIQVQLKDISITNCPKFVDSSVGWALQQLGSISVSTEDSNIETLSNVNEDKGMKKLISRAEFLDLGDSMNLLYVWEGPTFITFQNLQELNVIRCRRLKCIFSSTVMRSLPCLTHLIIEECEEMEEIMSSELGEEHKQFPNEFSNSSLCFPQLFQLSVSKCRKLKWLFPSLPSTQHLPRLGCMWIEECCQLRGLFNSEVEIQEESFYFNLLPNLRSLRVKDCPIFSETTLSNLQRLEQWHDRI